jgi:hypothetical protein
MSRRFHTTEWDLLPELAFRPRPGGGMTFEGGKGGSSAPAPDENIGIAQRELSALAKEQWTEFKTNIYPDLKASAAKQEERAQGLYDVTSATMKKQLEYSEKDRERYETGGIPLMEALRKEAVEYNEPAYQEMMALRAGADVATASENQRQQTMMRQQQYGIDPTSGVAAGNANVNSAITAAAQAQAQNQTRMAAKEIGLAKLGNAYNMYAGLPSQANTATNTGVAAGTTGVNTAQSGVTNKLAIADSFNRGTSTAMGGWNSVGQLGVGKYQADISAYNAQQQAEGAMWGGLGSAIGSGVALYASKGSDVRIKQNVKQVGFLPNGVPWYSFEYKPEYRNTWGHGVMHGTMAQDVEKIIPDAVSVHADGYKLVDYSKVLNHGI